MAKTNFLKAKAVCLALAFFSFNTYSQTCEVDKEPLKGTYTGDCKKNKAHGKGKAIGVDTYEGEFKNGIPDGSGTYTWGNKNVFEGKYVKGLREGRGKMTFKKEGTADSVVEGFWKKDVYIGKNEKAWQIYSRTGSITKVDVEHTPDKISRVRIIITNTSGGVASVGGQLPQYKVDNVVIVKGNFQRQTNLETHFKSTETSFFEITFPFRIKLMMSREELDVEMFEEGSYTINIAINN